MFTISAISNARDYQSSTVYTKAVTIMVVQICFAHLLTPHNYGDVTPDLSRSFTIRLYTSYIKFVPRYIYIYLCLSSKLVNLSKLHKSSCKR